MDVDCVRCVRLEACELCGHRSLLAWRHGLKAHYGGLDTDEGNCATASMATWRERESVSVEGLFSQACSFLPSSTPRPFLSLEHTYMARRGSLVVHSLGGTQLVVEKPRRIRGKKSAQAVWASAALRAQRHIAEAKGVPPNRVAIVANSADGSSATAVFSAGPPELSLGPLEGGKMEGDYYVKDDDDALVAALLCFAWERLESTRRAFRFEASGSALALEGLWWSDAARLIVDVDGQSWVGSMKSKDHAEAYGLCGDLAAATASALRRQPAGVLDGETAKPLLQLRII